MFSQKVYKNCFNQKLSWKIGKVHNEISMTVSLILNKFFKFSFLFQAHIAICFISLPRFWENLKVQVCPYITMIRTISLLQKENNLNR